MTTEQRDYILLCADIASPRAPKAKLEPQGDGRNMLLEVSLPGEGDEWDENEIELQEEIKTYLGAGYETTLLEAHQDMNGRIWSQLEIAAIGPVNGGAR